MKKILIFIDWFLPGYKAGGPISSNANLIEHLKDDFEFFVITRDTDYCEKIPYPNVVPNEWNMLPTGARAYYISNSKLSFRNLIKISKTIDFDVVYINGIYSLFFSLFPLIWFKYFARKKIVVAARGMLSNQTFSSKKGKKKLFYALVRAIGLYKGIVFQATNDDEANQIRKNVGFKGVIKVAPNLPPKIPKAEKRILPKIPGELRLISIARISPEKNTLYALQILESLKLPASSYQQVETQDPISTTCNLQPATCNLVFDLYGTIYSESYWHECQDIIHSLPSHIKVNFCGSLEKDKIQSTLKGYHFLFMPSQGENYGHSIVESLLAGCPVIISDRTPWKSLQEVHSPQSIVHSQKTPTPNTLSPAPKMGIGWDIALEQPQLFVEIMEYCLHMGQDDYDNMSLRTIEFAQQIIQDKTVMEANKDIFRG